MTRSVLRAERGTKSSHYFAHFPPSKSNLFTVRSLDGAVVLDHDAFLLSVHVSLKHDKVEPCVSCPTL